MKNVVFCTILYTVKKVEFYFRGIILFMRKKLLKITMTILVAGMCTACGNSANALYKQSIELEKEGKYEEALQSVQNTSQEEI